MGEPEELGSRLHTGAGVPGAQCHLGQLPRMAQYLLGECWVPGFPSKVSLHGQAHQAGVGLSPGAQGGPYSVPAPP